MPDRMVDEEEFARDEEKDAGASMDGQRRFKDFDCPDCNANNPYDESFGDGEEVRCFYCGQEFVAQVSDEGKLKLKSS